MCLKKKILLIKKRRVYKNKPLNVFEFYFFLLTLMPKTAKTASNASIGLPVS